MVSRNQHLALQTHLIPRKLSELAIESLLDMTLIMADDESYEFTVIASGRRLVIGLAQTTKAAIDLPFDLWQADDVVDEFGGIDPRRTIEVLSDCVRHSCTVGAWR